MESIDSIESGGNARKFLTSPRLEELKKEFEQNGGKWKEFKIGELFSVSSNPQLNKESFNFSKNGKYPYFTRTVFNNGILGYVDYLDNEHMISGNSIAVGMLGMQFFYMPSDFYAGQFTKTVFPRFKEFNEKLAIYFITFFNKLQKTLQGVLVRDFEKTFCKSKILLPVLSNGTPDFSYMERYICELEQARVSELAAYLQAAGLENYDLTAAEQTALDDFKNGKIRFKEFKIGELFDVVPSPYFGKIKRQLNVSKIQTNEFNLPLICAKKGNNGIMYYGRSNDFKSYKNVLSVVYNGAIAAGLVYAHDESIGIFTDSYLIKSKRDVTFKTNLFFKSVIEKCIYDKYSRELKAVWKRVKENTIFLPIKRNGTADFAFMESFITAQQKLAIKEVVLWKDKVISTTKKSLMKVRTSPSAG